MARGLLGLPWVVWAGVALAVAAVYSVVVPLAAVTHGLEHLVLRWFHALVWLLLGLSALVRGFAQGAPALADLLAGAALVLYLAYAVTLTRVRRRQP